MYEHTPTHHLAQLIGERHEELRHVAHAGRAARERGSLRGEGGSIRIRLHVRQRARRGLAMLGLTRTPLELS